MPFPAMLPGTDLPEELDQTLQQNATTLQGQQATLPGLEQQAPQPPQAPPPSPQGGQDPRQLYQEGRQRIEGQQQQLEARQGDQLVTERLMQVLDPNLPRPARQFLFKELSQQLGIDPKGPRSRDVGQLLTGLQPEELENVRRGLVERLRTSPPGSINEMARGVLTGDVSGADLLQLVQAPGGQQPPLVGGPQGRRPPTPSMPPAPETPAPGGVPTLGPRQPSAPIEARRMPGQGETPAHYQTVNPQLLLALGMDPRQQVRLQDLLDAGFTVPPSPEEQQKLATEILNNSAQTNTTLVEAARLNSLIKGRPEVLGPVGTVARTAESVLSQLEGVARLAGGVFDAGDGTTRKYLQMATDKFNKLFPEVTKTGVDSAVVQGALASMAYQLAQSRGIPGNRLTNAILNQHLAELGGAASPEIFQATLTDAIRRTIDTHARSIQTRVGQPNLPPNMVGLSNAELNSLAQNAEIMPASLREGLGNEIERRISAQGNQPSGPVKAAPEGTPDENLGPSPQPGGRQGRVIPRSSPTPEEEQGRQAADANRNRQWEDTQRTLAINNYMLALRRDANAERAADRADRTERRKVEEAKRARIQAAFSEIGKALSSSRAGASIGGGGAGGGGGEQDASAFKIAPPPRRTPPPIPQIQPPKRY